MPTVPRLEGRSVVPTPIAGVKQQVGAASNIAAFGTPGTGELGKGLAVAADALDALALEQDKRKAIEADVEYTSSVREILFGKDDGSTPGYYKSNGQVAVDQAQPTRDAILKLREDLSNSLSSPRSRELFNAKAAGRENSSLQNIGRHTIQQEKVAMGAVLESTMSEAMQDFTNSPFDEEVSANSIAATRNATFAQADLAGITDGATIDSMLEQNLTIMFDSAITGQLKRGNVAEAKELFEVYGGLMDAPARANLEGRLNEQTDSAQVQADVDAVRIEGGTSAEQRKFIRDNFEGDEETDRINELDKRIAEDGSNLRAAVGQAAASASEHVINQQLPFETWREQNPEEWAVLATDTNAVRNIKASEIAIIEGKTYADVSEPGLLGELRKLEPHILKEVVPSQYYARLSIQDAGKLDMWVAGAQEEVLKAGQATVNKQKFLTETFRRAPAELGFRASKRTDDQQEWWTQYQNEMEGFIRSYGDKPISDKERTDEVIRLLTEVTVDRDGIFSDDEIPVFRAESLTEAEQATAIVEIEDMSISRLESIRDFLKKRMPPGTDISDRLIEEYAGATEMKDRDRQRNLLEFGLPNTEFRLFIPAAMAGDRDTRVTGEGLFPNEDLDVKKKVTINPRALSFTAAKEGRRDTVYPGPNGHPTVGIGFNLDRAGAKKDIESVGANYDRIKNGTDKLTEEQIDTLFLRDMIRHERLVKRLFPKWKSFSEDRQIALIDMMFAMGEGTFKKFGNMIKAINSDDWEEAALQAQYTDPHAKKPKLSPWWTQTKSRAVQVVDMIRDK